MVHHDDEDSLQRMLGVAQVPPPLAEETALCLRMFHRGGGSGRLGPWALVEIARRLKYTIPPEVKPEDKVAEWREYPQDGSVMVEALFHGDWLPGRFLGFVQHGTLAVRVPALGMVKECRHHMVRYVGVAPPEREAPPPKAKLLEADDAPPAPMPMTEAEMLTVDDANPEDEVDLAEPEPVEPVALLPPGKAVWVEDEDDCPEGVVVASTPDGMLTVQIEGEEEPRDFPAAAVLPQPEDLVAQQPATEPGEDSDGTDGADGTGEHPDPDDQRHDHGDDD